MAKNTKTNNKVTNKTEENYNFVNFIPNKFQKPVDNKLFRTNGNKKYNSITLISTRRKFGNLITWLELLNPATKCYLATPM